MGPLGRLLWARDSQYFLNCDGHDNYVRRLAPPVRSGGNVSTTLSCSASGIFTTAAILRDIQRGAPMTASAIASGRLARSYSWKLEAALKCRFVQEGCYAPPVHMIKLTDTREITSCLWVHPAEERFFT
jgi:hypothetical protein